MLKLDWYLNRTINRTCFLKKCMNKNPANAMFFRQIEVTKPITSALHYKIEVYINSLFSTTVYVNLDLKVKS